MEKNTLQKAMVNHYLVKLQNENIISHDDAIKIKKLLEVSIKNQNRK